MDLTLSQIASGHKKSGKALKSKHVEFGTLGFAEFAKSETGTVASYFLGAAHSARNEVSKTIKSACVKSGSKCEISTTNILIEQTDGTWHPGHVLNAVIIAQHKQDSAHAKS